MKYVKIAFLIVFLLLFGVFFANTAGSLTTDSPIQQPIAFSHQSHVEGLEIECTVCHQSVMEQEFAGRPTLQVCKECHDENTYTDSPEEAKLVEYIQSGQELPWNRLYDVPSHVYYSHRRHTAVAQIECAECHGDIGQASSPPERPLKLLTMDFCMDCHEQKGVTTDCNTCHR